MAAARKLNDQHEVWYVDGIEDLAETLVKAGLAVSKLNQTGSVISVDVQFDTESLLWNATLVVDRSSV